MCIATGELEHDTDAEVNARFLPVRLERSRRETERTLALCGDDPAWYRQRLEADLVLVAAGIEPT